MRLVLLSSCFFLLAACGAPPKADCGPSNCSGCCSMDGECYPGNQNVACGNGGGLCDVCGFSSRCELGACFFSQVGGGGGTTGGGGGAVGGGGGATGGGGGSTGGGGGSLGGGGGSTTGGGGGAIGGGGGSTGGGGGSTGGGGGSVGGGGGSTGGGGGSTGGGGGSTGGGGGSTGGGGGSTGGGGGSTGGGGGSTGGGGGYVGDGGFQLYFRGSIDGGTQNLIHLAAPATAVPVLASTPNRRTGGFAVTPSGALLAIAYDGTPSDELVMVPTGGAPLSIRTTPASLGINSPLISPDEQQVAWLEGTSTAIDGGVSGFDLYVASAVSTSTPRLASPPRATPINLLNASLARFSPDSRYLAVRGDFNVNQAFELHVFDTQTGQRTPLVIATGATAGGVTNFGWTSAGQLVVHGALDGNPERLHLCSVTGACTQFTGPALNATIDALAVSPDGTFVVYASNERGGQYDLYRAPATGGTPMRLAPDAPSGWRPTSDGLVISPNGQWVALVTTAGALQVLSTTGNASLLALYTAVAPVGVFSLTFSPNSSQLAFRGDLAIDGAYDLYRLVNFTTSAQTPVLLQSSNGGSIIGLQWTN